MTGQEFHRLLKSIDSSIQMRAHNARSITKQAQIAAEYGTSFWQVLVDYSKTYSFTFTMQALGLHKDTYAYCKVLFTPRLMQKQERPHMKGNRRHSYYPPIPVDCPVTRSTVYWRLKHGWTWEQAIGKHSMRTSKSQIANLGTTRNTGTWKSIITKECEGAKAYGKETR